MGQPPKIKNNVKVLGNLASGKSLVLVHGFGTDQTSWNSLIPAFAEDHKIIVFDHVGAGESDPEAFVQYKYLSLKSYTGDLLDICEDLGVQDACVIGHSAGGMIAALATIARKQHFSKLVLLGASPKYLNDAQYVGGLTENDLKTIYSTVVDNFLGWVSDFAPKAMNDPEKPELAQHFAQTIRRIKPENVLTVLCSILQSDYRREIQNIALPTLILHTREDLFVPLDVALYLRDHIPHSRLVSIQARGHFPHMSAPQEVARAIRGFL
jgi:sigma-B regulation protein RsbQ